MAREKVIKVSSPLSTWPIVKHREMLREVQGLTEKWQEASRQSYTELAVCAGAGEYVVCLRNTQIRGHKLLQLKSSGRTSTSLTKRYNSVTNANKSQGISFFIIPHLLESCDYMRLSALMSRNKVSLEPLWLQ